MADLFDDDDAAPAAPRLAANVGVVIINYRTPDLIIQCLAALGPQLEQVGGRAVIVDNHSEDGSPDKIAAYLDAASLDKGSFLEKDGDDTSWKERINLVRSKKNTGFSGGNNIGVSYLDSPFYVLLNSDTILREGALANLIDAAARHPEAGVIGPRLEDIDGAAQQSAFRFHSPLSEFLSGAHLGPLDALFRFALIARPVSDTPQFTDWVSFACVLIRRDAIDAAGPMDEGYFMYYEDADYCHAITKAGFRIQYNPTARVVHLRGGSSPVKSAIKSRKRPPAYYYASRTRFFAKKYGPLGPILANFAWHVGRVAARLRLIKGETTPQTCHRQGPDQWTNWRSPLGDRRAPE